MAYGTVKVDNITFDNGGSDQNVTVSGLYNSLTSGITVTGTISGAVVIGSTSVSGTTVAGVTVTGTTVQGASGTFTSLTGTTTTGTTSSFTSGVFTTLSGATATFTSGIIASGTAAAPSLAILGDPDTGVFSPGANQVAVATNATERLRIDSSGRLLVGTSTSVTSSVSQQSLLQVYSTSSSASSIQIGNYTAGVNAAGLHFDKSRGATVGTNTVLQSGDNIGSIKFNGADGTNLVRAAGIDCAVDGTPGANDMPGRLVFSTTADGASSPTERLRITSAGLVGIGTSVPAGLLNVSSNTAGNPSLTYDTSNIANFDYGIIQLALGINDATPFGAFLQARDNTNAARVISLNPSGGNVGIGTTSPNRDLEIASPVPGIRLTDNDEVNKYTEFQHTAGSTIISSRNDTGNGPIRFQGVGGGSASEYARFDGSGRLLVGTSSARDIEPYGLDVSGQTAHTYEDVGDTSPGPGIALGSSSITAQFGPYLYLFRSRGGSVGSNTSVSSGDNLGTISFAGADGTDVRTRGAAIHCEVDGTPGANDMPGRLVFSTTADGASTPTERMRINSGGTVSIAGGIGQLANKVTNAGNVFLSTAAGTNTGGVSIESYGTTTGTRVHFSFSNPNGVVGSISTNASATAYNTSSDYRLKENITLLDGAIARLNQLPVHRFNFIADPDTVVDGFIAHEAQEVVPECVTGTKDEVDDDGNPVMQGIDQSKLVPLLTAALQEAIAKIEVLEQRLNDAGIN